MRTKIHFLSQSLALTLSISYPLGHYHFRQQQQHQQHSQQQQQHHYQQYQQQNKEKANLLHTLAEDNSAHGVII